MHSKRIPASVLNVFIEAFGRIEGEMDMNIKEYIEKIPEVREAVQLHPVFWINDKKCSGRDSRHGVISPEKIRDASQRLERFAPYLAQVFPETAAMNGIIESPLKEIPAMKAYLNHVDHADLAGRLFLKMDSHLPISGSIKARGGIYEVLKHAEKLAVREGLLTQEDDYRKLGTDEMKTFFQQYTVQVGSTGNLGLSIGIISAQLGFQVVVHMSADAKQWKKDLLRSKGVTVKEYTADYCAAVKEGRANSNRNPKSYFVDDENSEDLFLGYSVAGERLKKQLEERGVTIDKKHPLFVYLPCGIGGAPGGVAYGLKEAYGDNVHCFFTEPVAACCMLLGMATGLHDRISVQDFGIDGKTDADGLAVGRPSAFVGKVMEKELDGICTIRDETLYRLMKALYQREGIFIEPSACASFAAFLHGDAMKAYIKREGLTPYMGQAVHIAWATGGNMVPEEMVNEYLNHS